MKKFLLVLFLGSLLPFTACSNTRSGTEDSQNSQEDQTEMTIHVTSNGNTTVFAFNDSTASRELYNQLPLTIKVEDFSSNEKIFYPPEKLGTAGTPRANAKEGSLSYYAPWGDVVMFYEDFGSASGLYDLGHAVSGKEFIRSMSGTVEIVKGE